MAESLLRFYALYIAPAIAPAAMEEFCKKIREMPEPPILLRVMRLPRGGTTHAHVREMLLPGFEGPNLNAWGVVKRKLRQGVKAMSTSAHTFLSKK
jgi:hypothetical protein